MSFASGIRDESSREWGRLLDNPLLYRKIGVSWRKV
jgi:hypothetical protein